MINEHNLEKANFRLLIENDGIGKVDERLNIIEVFLDTEEHLTLRELTEFLVEKGYDYEPDFIRQCMKRWIEYGFAQEVNFNGQEPRYEHRHLGKHHDHLICTKCGKILEFCEDEIEDLQLKIAAQYRFQILQHKMEIYGLCSQCLETRRNLMPLSMGKPGERLIVRELTNGRTARSKLISLGLCPGGIIEVLNNDGRGRLVVRRNSTRLAMGRGLAQKIMVSLAQKEEAAWE